MQALDAVGVDARVGPALFATFSSAGLPDPDLVLEAPVGGGLSTPKFGWTNAVRALLPVLERLGVTTADEADVDTLAARFDAEIAS